jgi:uncharacterized MAPEG superfamily protein
MNATALSLIGFAAWFLALTFALAALRVQVTLSTGKTGFAPDGSDLPGLGRRLTRARDNCFETLPVFVAIVAAAGLLGQISVLDVLAPWVLASRVAQSLTHIVSVASAAIAVRALCLAVQLAIYIIWIAALLAGGP